MRKVLFFLAVFGLFLVSCDQGITVDIDSTLPMTIDKESPLNEPVVLIIEGLGSSIEAELNDNGVNKDIIDAINLKELKLSIKTPADQTFTMLTSVKAFLNAEGLEKKEIAAKTNVQNNTKELILDVSSDTDLKEYLLKNSLEFSVETIVTDSLSEDINIDVYGKFSVTGSLL